MSERLAEILVSSFTRILIPGIKVTIPLTLLSFVFGCIIALFLALVQIANVKGMKQFARFYIWVFRGTPLIVQLFIIFFGLPSVGIILDAFPSAVIAFALNLGAYNAEGLCVQCMHVGSYDAEPETLEQMDAFAREQGYETDFTGHRRHHEIYLSDPRRTAPEKLKTVLRHPVRVK